ncbi:hypothetical protein BGW80DRAFT_147841 [Lactifluus volemus]|nr:hypothetical protein BGW80DRAFT_147841 [Lactifluus volemus]
MNTIRLLLAIYCRWFAADSLTDRDQLRVPFHLKLACEMLNFQNPNMNVQEIHAYSLRAASLYVSNPTKPLISTGAAVKLWHAFDGIFLVSSEGIAPTVGQYGFIP